MKRFLFFKCFGRKITNFTNSILFVMTIKILFGVCCGAVIVSCIKKESATEETNRDSISKPDVTIIEECYQFTNNNDTVSLSISREEHNAKGQLIYNFFDKDDSKGTFKGVIKGDTLIAVYTFQAEGRGSEREVVFLKSGASYLPGYGDMEEQNNKQVFKNPNALKFDDIVVLKQSACK